MENDNASVIAFTGRHGTGKTTMINHFVHNNPFPDINVYAVKSRAKNIYADHNVRIQDPLPYEKRLEIQKDVFSSWIDMMYSCKKNLDPRKKNIILTDRSPLDIAAYLFVDYVRGISDNLEAETKRFLNTALIYASDHNTADYNNKITTHIVYDHTFDIGERGFSNLFDLSYLAIHDKFLNMLSERQHKNGKRISDIPNIVRPDNLDLESNKDTHAFIFNKRYIDLLNVIQNIFYPHLIKR